VPLLPLCPREATGKPVTVCHKAPAPPPGGPSASWTPGAHRGEWALPSGLYSTPVLRPEGPELGRVEFPRQLGPFRPLVRGPRAPRRPRHWRWGLHWDSSLQCAVAPGGPQVAQVGGDPSPPPLLPLPTLPVCPGPSLRVHRPGPRSFPGVPPPGWSPFSRAPARCARAPPSSRSVKETPMGGLRGRGRSASVPCGGWPGASPGAPPGALPRWSCPPTPHLPGLRSADCTCRASRAHCRVGAHYW